MVARPSHFSCIGAATIELRFPRRRLSRDEFSHSIVPSGPRLFVANRCVIGVFRSLRVTRAFQGVFHLRGLQSSVQHLRVRISVANLVLLFNFLFGLMRDVSPMLHLYPAHLQLATRPIRLLTGRIANPIRLNVRHIRSFLSFFRVVTMVSFVLVGLFPICLSGLAASAVRGVAIIHRRRGAGIHTEGVSFRPFNRFRIRIIN